MVSTDISCKLILLLIILAIFIGLIIIKYNILVPSNQWNNCQWRKYLPLSLISFIMLKKGLQQLFFTVEWINNNTKELQRVTYSKVPHSLSSEIFLSMNKRRFTVFQLIIIIIVQIKSLESAKWNLSIEMSHINNHVYDLNLDLNRRFLSYNLQL